MPHPSSSTRPRIVPGILDGATVVVVGGSSGFGRQVVLDAAESGARVVVIGRDAAKAADVAREAGALGGEAVALGADATTPAGLEAIAAAVGEADHLVSTLGGAMGGGFMEASFAEIRATVEGKVFDNLALVRALAPRLRAGGSITLTAGTGGSPATASGAYLGNEGIATLVRGLAVELAPRLRVNAVAPTWTPTPLWRDVPEADVARTRRHFDEVIPLGRTGDVEEVAQAYLFLMTCGFVTGQTLAVDGGMALV
ncbi:SDR family oxidoreductase [Demequina sp. SYSU T00192]|uniref:SDR family oxidoreductase n=1 Tax=Demequina litoralis TaxID=3051660 RepID=A0ABT8GCK0_9MICO|nr:SDR family oxidoreductase [Demequina sp. SYSU T00192]MDN4476858.1 SDR family oxidoreductase [Demequina sp. SYSU T00192]